MSIHLRLESQSFLDMFTIKAMLYLKEHGKISNREYRQIANISDEWARVDLADLILKGLVRLVGKGRGAHYVPAQVGD